MSIPNQKSKMRRLPRLPVNDKIYGIVFHLSFEFEFANRLDCMKKVFVVGDSISMHYGPYLERFLEGRYLYGRKGGDEDAAPNLDQPTGANGGDSGMVRDYLADLLDGGSPGFDVLLLNCGLHDIKTEPATGARQVSLADYERNLQWIVDKVGAAGIRLIWIRTTPVDEKIHNRPGMTFWRFEKDQADYNAAADRIMRAAGVVTIDLEGFSLRCGDSIFCDHVHFVVDVREKQAAFIAGFLNAVI